MLHIFFELQPDFLCLEYPDCALTEVARLSKAYFSLLFYGVSDRWMLLTLCMYA
jgi:hypothetical protein